jgi:hypothetical protein
MAYTLEQFAADCRAALKKNPGPAGRDQVRKCVEKACSDADFVAKYFGPDNTSERTVLYEDPELRFCICAHAYKGAKGSAPHDHGPSWAIYGQARGVTEMTEWRCIQKPAGGKPGKVEKLKTYSMTPGTAYVYNEGVLHSPSRQGDTCLIRIEGQNLIGVKRDKYEVATVAA